MRIDRGKGFVPVTLPDDALTRMPGEVDKVVTDKHAGRTRVRIYWTVIGKTDQGTDYLVPCCKTVYVRPSKGDQI